MSLSICFVNLALVFVQMVSYKCTTHAFSFSFSRNRPRYTDSTYLKLASITATSNIEPIIELPERETFQDYLNRTTVKIQNKLITPTLLRNMEFTDVDGNTRKIVNKDKAVVVFLRHLGDFACKHVSLHL